jgi:hypothetical protein
MAQIRPDTRQIAEPNAPDLSGAARAHEGISRAIQQVTNAVGSAVDSYNKLEADAQYSETLNQLNKNLVNSLSRENIAQGNSYERFIQEAEATIEGGLQHTPKKYQKAYSQSLREKVNQLGLKLASADLAFRENLAKAEGLAILESQMGEYNEALASGNETGAIVDRAYIDNTIDNLKNIGVLDPLDEYKLRKQMNKAATLAEYSSKYQKLLRTNPVEADLYLKEITDQKPDNLSHEDWNDVQATLLKDHAQYNKMVDAAENLGYDEFKLEFDSGKINSINELNNYIAQKETDGRYFSPTTKLKMQDMLVQQLRKDNKEKEFILEMDRDVEARSDNIYNYTGEQYNKYVQTKTDYLYDALTEEAAGNPNMQVPSKFAIRASIATKIPVKVSSFTKEFEDKLLYGSINDFEEALNVGSQLYKESPKTFGFFDATTQAYQRYAATMAANTTLPVQDIKRYADQAVLNKTTETKSLIDKKLTEIHKKNSFKDLYKDVYGVNFVNPAVQPEYNALVAAFDTFYQAVGDQDLASDLTREYLRTRSGKSQYVPKNTITKDPIEETYIFQNHPTLAKNEMAMAAYEVVLNRQQGKEKGLDLSPSVEWPDGIAMPDWNSLTEDKVYNNLIWRNEKGKEVPPQLKINGKNRKLLFINPSSDLETPGTDQREIWYEDDNGVAQPLYVNVEEQYGPNLMKADTGIPHLEFIPFHKITPTIAQLQGKKELEKRAEFHLREEFKRTRQESERIRDAESREAQKMGPYYAPRANPVDEAVNEARRMNALQKEEERFVLENLEKKIQELQSSKADKFITMIRGKQ